MTIDEQKLLQLCSEQGIDTDVARRLVKAIKEATKKPAKEEKPVAPMIACLIDRDGSLPDGLSAIVLQGVYDAESGTMPDESELASNFLCTCEEYISHAQPGTVLDIEEVLHALKPGKLRSHHVKVVGKSVIYCRVIEPHNVKFIAPDEE